MARRHRRRGRHSFKIPVVTTAILVGQAALAWEKGGHNGLEAAKQFAEFYTGINFNQGTFNATDLIFGYGPWLAKGLIMKVARPLGARPHIPFGLPISIS